MGAYYVYAHNSVSVKGVSKLYIIKRKDRLLTHIGLCVDESMVIHFGSKTGNMFAKDKDVLFCSIQEFSHGRKVYLTPIEECIELSTICDRATRIKNSQRKYRLLKNNCISFVLMCINGTDSASFADILQMVIHYRIQLLAFLLD